MPLSNAELAAIYAQQGDPEALLELRTGQVEEAVVSAFRRHLEPAATQPVAAVAVAGFGRREMFPHSDVDLLLLSERDLTADVERQAIRKMLGELWDQGMRVSQQVHTVESCSRLHPGNYEMTMALLDQRFLCGAGAVWAKLSERLPKLIRAERATLLRFLEEQTTQRWMKFHFTLYQLEPNIKEGPGGLRDLHVLHWAARIRGSEALEDQPLADARRFLWDLRCRLHLAANRDQNLLNFDSQEAMSSEPAEWMREFYRRARTVHRTAMHEKEAIEAELETGLMKSFRDWRSRLSNAEFTALRERVYFRSPQQLESDPELAVRLFQFVARHGIRLAHETERRLAAHREGLLKGFGGPRKLWPQLRELFSLPNAALALRQMHETGVLEAIFPEWREIDCLVVRDFYHRYTVDEHTLVTVESLSELAKSKDPARARFTELLEECQDEKALLVMALLFHDVGKSDGLEGHAGASMRLVEGAMDRIGAGEQDKRMVGFLVREHLALSAVMNGRDLNDPATAVESAERVGTVERLRLLALMTYADISAVNPSAMTAWRLEQLWRVYRMTYQELTRELGTARIETARIDDPARAAFLAGFPKRYLAIHTEEDVRRHQKLAEGMGARGVAVELARQQGVWRTTVITRDHPRLFATLAGTLAGFGMNIRKAEAFSNQQSLVLDTFVFEDPLRNLELNPPEVDRLKLILERAALGKEDVEKRLRGRPRPSQAGSRFKVPASVTISDRVAQDATLIEVIAEDRPGLLYELASAMSNAGCDIEVVLIDTEAHKAIDVFYVKRGGARLDAAAAESLRAALVEVCGR